MGNEGLSAAGRRAWESAKYSDLIVSCKGHEFKVHKFALCFQSDFFATAVKKEAFEEGQSGVIEMDEDDPTVVAAMLEFLYTSDYLVPRHNQHFDEVKTQENGEHIASTDQGQHPLLFHVDVYALADRIQNANLKRAAEDKFEAAATTAWQDHEFPTAIESVYANTPPGPSGNRLRRISTEIAAKHARVLLDRDQRFRDMMDGVAEFGTDLVDVLSASIDKNGTAIECPRSACGFVFRANLDTDRYRHVDQVTCPICAKKMSTLELLL